MKSIIYIIALVLQASIINDYLLAQDKTSGLLERSQIEEKYKWDLSDIYKNVKTGKKISNGLNRISYNMKNMWGD